MFDQSRFADMNEYNDYLVRKLKHYNQWLCDPKRPIISGPYPGFPEDLDRDRAVESLKAEYRQRAEVKKQQEEIVVDTEKKPRKPRAKKMGDGVSRQDQALEIYKRLNGDRTAVVQAIQDELGMPPGSAMTYFYNAKKAVV